MNTNNELLSKLALHLGEVVVCPNKQKMVLTEIYYNGNVACIPLDCHDYYKQLKEFHADSIQVIE